VNAGSVCGASNIAGASVSAAGSSRNGEDKAFVFSLLDFEMKGSIGAAGRLTGLGMTPAHYGGIEPFF